MGWIASIGLKAFGGSLWGLVSRNMTTVLIIGALVLGKFYIGDKVRDENERTRLEVENEHSVQEMEEYIKSMRRSREISDRISRDGAFDRLRRLKCEACYQDEGHQD